MDKRILVVDFGASGADLERALRADGLIPVSARDRAEVLAQFAEAPPDAVLLAVDPASDRHREIVRIVRATPQGHVPILFYGEGGEGAPIRAPSEALAQGGDYFFRLPCDLNYLAGRARAWAERGAKHPEPVAAPLSREAPQLEGFEYGEAPSPLLERLRAPPIDTHQSPDWNWVGELDHHEPVEPLELEVLAVDEGEGLRPAAYGAAGISIAEQDALLNIVPEPHHDPLEDLRIEEVEDLPIAPAASTLARIELATNPGKEPSSPPEGPLWMSDESLFTEGLSAPSVPDEPLELAEEEVLAPDPVEEVRPAAPEGPREISFPPIEPSEAAQVVSGRRKVEESRISPDTLEALRQLLTRKDGPEPLERAEVQAPDRTPPSDVSTPSPEAQASTRPPRETDLPPLRPDEDTSALSPDESVPPPDEAETIAADPDADADDADVELPEPSLEARAEASVEEDPFDVYEPTLTVMPEERHALSLAPAKSRKESEGGPITASAPPAQPIGEDEETQELFMAPIAAASPEQDDFPPGALSIIHQAELQRQRGAPAEACAGYALAAQIYLDHSLKEPAKSLYRQILALDPEHPFAAQRLSVLEGREDIVLEFVDDFVPDAAQDLVLEGAKACDEGDLSQFLRDIHGDLRLAEVHPPAGPPARPEHSVTLGLLQPTPLSPAQGRIQGVSDLVELFLRARAQRATGALDFGDSLKLQIAHGVPSGLVGEAVVPSFLRLVADVGRIGEATAREWARIQGVSPRALARRLASQGRIDPDEAILLPTRHLEDQLVRFLQHRGEWVFEPAIDARTDDLVPRVAELREWLVELLPRAAPVEELKRALQLGPRTVRIVPGTDHFVATPDIPLVNLLDGRRGLEEAARLAGSPIARAHAWALVWLQEGLAELVERPEHSESSRPQRSAPPLRNLPALKPRPSPARSGFRLERKPLDTRPPTTTPHRRFGGLSSGRVGATGSGARLRDGLATARGELDRETVLAGLDEEARVKAMAELVRTQDYFGILDVDSGASRKAIDDAHRRVRQLVPENVDADLEVMVREVLRSVDEARDVLMIPELRAAYEHHLEPRG